VSVTPADASTAALYEYTPVVAVGQAGGNWLFWNLWQAYAAAINYSPPPGFTGPTAWIGDACTFSSACVYGTTAGTCATQFKGGLCTLTCTTACPSSPDQVGTVCADFGSAGYCFPVCNPVDPQCRDGYTCKNVATFANPSNAANVCFPQ
jgi:hypothetical protein